MTRDDASNVWALSAADKNIHYEIVWFAGRPVAQVTPAGPKLYTFTDHLGTPLLQTDATRTSVWQAEYEPFGNIYEMREGKRTDQPLRFPGQEVAMNWEGQEENYNIFRWYRSGWGRYTQSDPFGLRTESREKWGLSPVHLFSYVDANPITRIDPYGADWVDWIPSKPIKCSVWYDKCASEVLTCCKKWNKNSVGEDDVVTEAFSNAGQASPAFSDCFLGSPNCMKFWKKGCALEGFPKGPPPGYPKASLLPPKGEMAQGAWDWLKKKWSGL